MARLRGAAALLFPVFFGAALLFFPDVSAAAAREGVTLCLQTVLPSLFPFFVLSSLLVQSDVPRLLSRAMAGVMYPLFGVSGAGASALILGLLGGYPVGARTVAELYGRGEIAREEAEQLLAFCNNSGPGFFLGVCGTAVFGSARAGAYLYLIHVGAALVTRWGRKATALLGYGFTVAGLMTPYAAGADCALGWYFAGFGLLGIGNTAIQVAVNPLLATIVPGERMTSYLTVGQIFRNTSLLLLAPIVTGLVAATGSWRLLLPIYAGLTVVGGLWLQLTPVPEPAQRERSAGLADCFRLLKNRAVLLSTLGVACFIAADVGIGFLSVRLIDNPSSILTTTGFYACRIVGTLIGAWVLVKVSDVKYLTWNMTGALALCAALLFVRNEAAIYAAVGVLGFAMACVFATFYAVATKAVPENANEVAGLMIMAISAGAVSGPVCGAIVRAWGNPHLGMLFVAACVAYMLWASIQLKMKN